MKRAIEAANLVSWVNGELQTEYKTLDQLKDGVALVQLIHKIAPDSFELSRCDFLASTPYHYEKNFKLLQEAMRTNDINRDFIIERLMQGEKQRDLYIFVAYLKLHYETFKTQHAWRREDERKVTKKELQAATKASSSGTVCAEAGGSRSTKPPRPPSSVTSRPSAAKPVTTATLGAPCEAEAPADESDAGTTSAASAATALPGVLKRNGGGTSPLSNSGSAAVGGSFSVAASVTALIAYDPVAERNRARRIRMEKMRAYTSSAILEAVSNSDTQSSAPSRHTTGGLGIRAGWAGRLRMRRDLDDKVGARPGNILRWANGIQSPAASSAHDSGCSTPHQSHESVASVAMAASAAALAPLQPPPFATPREQQQQSSARGAVGFGASAPSSEPRSSISMAQVPSQPSFASVPPSPLSALNNQMSFTRFSTSIVGGGTINAEVSQIVHSGGSGAGTALGTGSSSIVGMVAGHSTLTDAFSGGEGAHTGSTTTTATTVGGTTARNLSAELSGANSATFPLSVQQALIFFPGITCEPLDCLIGANFWAPDGAGWPVLGPPHVDVVGERTARLYTHEELVSLKREALRQDSGRDGGRGNGSSPTIVAAAVATLPPVGVATLATRLAAWDEFDQMLEDD